MAVRGQQGCRRSTAQSRLRTTKPFGHIQRAGAISGFAEAPSLSDDGRILYYHELNVGPFRIMTVERP